MDIDRQAIERRDFPISRRGYEPAAVDAHLRALASEIEQLQRERTDGGPEPSLATTAGSQVQSILAATEAAAADIEQQARESAHTTREDADRDAAQTRAEAIERARAHVAAVSQATAALLERVGAMDSEVSALVESLRGGANRLAADLAAVETNMGELYDAAAGRPLTSAVAGGAQPTVPVPPSPGPPAPTASAPPPIPPPPASGAAAPAVKHAQSSPPPLSPPESAEPEAHVDPEAPPRQRIAGGLPTGSTPAEPDSSDLDSARLVALNMALNGDSREDAERYLAENFTLADRGKLIDEVFAAIEG